MQRVFQSEAGGVRWSPHLSDGRKRWQLNFFRDLAENAAGAEHGQPHEAGHHAPYRTPGSDEAVHCLLEKEGRAQTCTP